MGPGTETYMCAEKQVTLLIGTIFLIGIHSVVLVMGKAIAIEIVAVKPEKVKTNSQMF